MCDEFSRLSNAPAGSYGLDHIKGYSMNLNLPKFSLFFKQSKNLVRLYRIECQYK
ncbi:unnamed protein product [Amoebophrya sp. A25]|nr:unnamed protein product [Amoebophrya sp. A25]|eukprot:GSA25T00020113001.1